MNRKDIARVLLEAASVLEAGASFDEKKLQHLIKKAVAATRAVGELEDALKNVSGLSGTLLEDADRVLPRLVTVRRGIDTLEGSLSSEVAFFKDRRKLGWKGPAANVPPPQPLILGRGFYVLGGKPVRFEVLEWSALNTPYMGRAYTAEDDGLWEQEHSFELDAGVWFWTVHGNGSRARVKHAPSYRELK